MRGVAIVGVGQTKFGVSTETSRSLGVKALLDALDDAGTNGREIQAAYVGHYGLLDRQKGLIGHLVLSDAGITQRSPIPITRVEDACSSGAVALREAYIAVAGGFYDVAVALGVEKMTHLPTIEALTGMAQGREQDIEGVMGMNPIGIYGMKARLHMERYGTSEEQLALVAVKSYKNAASNPYAHFQKNITKEDVLNSPSISPPLHRYNFCPFSDGAAAAILVSEDLVKKYTDTPVYVAASVQKSGFFDDSGDLLTERVLGDTAVEAYEKAGISAKDVDLAEVHDASSIAEILAYEALGFCPEGEGGKFVEEGQSQIGGSTPVNASGGLTAKGHPVGATGLGQTFEAVKQLRGEAGKIQVPHPEYVLTHTMGGLYRGEECNKVVHIFKR